MMTGRIQKALSGFYYVDTGAEIVTCRARGKFRKEGLSPLVGDRVELRELGNGEGFIERILPRKNEFARPAVANIDQLVIIASAAIPKTDPFLIDRVVAIAELKGCYLKAFYGEKKFAEKYGDTWEVPVTLPTDTHAAYPMGLSADLGVVKTGGFN